MNEACKRCQLDVVRILLKKADDSLFDLDEAVTCVYETMSCDQEFSLVVKKLLSVFHISEFDVEYIINEACKRRQLDVVKILYENADHSLFDLGEVVKCIYVTRYLD